MYVTPAEIRDVIGSPQSDDNVLQALIDGAEALFNTLIDSPTGLLSSQKTEFVPFNTGDFSAKYGYVFILETYAPTSVSTINGSSAGTLGVDYGIIGRKLILKTPVLPAEFPKGWTIVYTSGLSSVPNEIKLAIRDVVAHQYNARKASGISEFKQDLLTVKYGGNPDSALSLATIGDDNLQTAFNVVAQKYKIHKTFVV